MRAVVVQSLNRVSTESQQNVFFLKRFSGGAATQLRPCWSSRNQIAGGWGGSAPRCKPSRTARSVASTGTRPSSRSKCDEKGEFGVYCDEFCTMMEGEQMYRCDQCDFTLCVVCYDEELIDHT